MGKTEHENVKIIGGTFEDRGDEIQEKFNKYDKQIREKILDDFLAGEKRGEVLDLGCSIGAWGEYLAKKGFKKIMGIDISPERAAKARSRGYYSEVEVMDAKNLKFKDSSFSTIVHIDVLVHILQKKDREMVFQEASRVLKKDGIFIFSLANRKYANNIKFLKALVGKKHEEEYYCNPIMLEEAKELADKNKLHIEKISSCTFAYPKFLIKYPAILSSLDVLGKTPLREYGSVIFVKTRKK